MELFLFVSMGLTIVTFFLIVVSEPAAPSLAEHDSDHLGDYSPEERASEILDQFVIPAATETTVSSNKTIQPLPIAV